MKYIGVQFGEGAKIYDYKTLHTHEKGDYVVVKNQYNGQVQVVRVVRMYDDYTPDPNVQYTWIVQPVDFSQYDRLIAADHEGKPRVDGRL